MGPRSNKKIKRKQYFIIPKFQLKYIAYILLFLYIGAAVAGYTVYYTTWVTLGDKLARVYPRGRLVHIFHTANVTLILRLLLLTPLFILIGTFISHRIAGPIYRLGRYIDTLRRGDYSRGVKLRKRDELKSLARKLSGLSKKLREQQEHGQKAVEEVMELIEKQDLDPGTRSQIRERLEKIPRSGRDETGQEE